MTDNQKARAQISNLLAQLDAEAHPRRQVELLDEIMAICNQHNLTHYDCVVARERLAQFGEHADLLRQKRVQQDK